MYKKMSKKLKKLIKKLIKEQPTEASEQKVVDIKPDS